MTGSTFFVILKFILILLFCPWNFLTMSVKTKSLVEITPFFFSCCFFTQRNKRHIEVMHMSLFIPFTLTSNYPGLACHSKSQLEPEGVLRLLLKTLILGLLYYLCFFFLMRPEYVHIYCWFYFLCICINFSCRLPLWSKSFVLFRWLYSLC